MWPDKLIPFAIIALIIVLIIFGPKQLPELGKSLGKTMKAIRDGAEGKTADDDADKTDADAKKDADAKSATASSKKSDSSGDEAE